MKIVANPTFTHTVTVKVPVNGGHRDETFKATFKVVPEGEYDELSVVTNEGMREFLIMALESCADLVDEAGKELEWNDGLRDQLLSLPYVRLALMRTYSDAVAKIRPGN